MGIRNSWRVSARIIVKYSYKDKLCTGTTVNLSEEGMFIVSDKIPLPEKSRINISFPVKDEVLSIPGKLIRHVKVDEDQEGIGVMFSDPPKKYTDFLEELLYVM